MEPVSHESRERYARRGIDARLRQVFDALDGDGDGRVSPRELTAALRRLGARPDPSARWAELSTTMVWEVDEDHDGAAGWAEFRRAYDRCAADADACEPRQLYNVVLFILHAEGAVAAARGGAAAAAGGHPVKMTAEDATRLMYLQHGREGMDAELEATFQAKAAADLTLEEFLKAMTARDVSLRRRRGRRPAPGRTAAAAVP